MTAIAVVAIAYAFFRTNKLMSNFGGSGDIFGMSKSKVKIYGIDKKVKVMFKDVAGLD